MKIVPFDQQPPEDKYLALDSTRIHPKMYTGQDSIVIKDVVTGRAIHVYHASAFEIVLGYACCVNVAASSLETRPFSERLVLAGVPYTAEAHVNPVEEVGEKFFSFKEEKPRKQVYTVSPFIDAVSLCWPYQAEDEQQRNVARCFDMLFYDRLNNWIESQSAVKGIDINPVNVKFEVDEYQKKIRLTVTDLAKNIGDIAVSNMYFC